MRIAAGFLCVCLLLCMGCRTSPGFICGTAMFQMAMEFEEAQVSNHVFCPKEEAEQVLTVTFQAAGRPSTTAATFYFRAKRAGERMTHHAEGRRLRRADLPWTQTHDQVEARFRGAELSVYASSFESAQSIGGAIAYGRDLTLTENDNRFAARWATLPARGRQ